MTMDNVTLREFGDIPRRFARMLTPMRKPFPSPPEDLGLVSKAASCCWGRWAETARELASRNRDVLVNLLQAKPKAWRGNRRAESRSKSDLGFPAGPVDLSLRTSLGLNPADDLPFDKSNLNFTGGAVSI